MIDNNIVIIGNKIHEYIYVKPTNDSRHINELMGDNYIKLSFYSTSLIEVPIGASVNYNDEVYKMYQTPKVTKENSSSFRYDCTFYGLKSLLKNYIFVEQNNDKTNCRQSFTMTANPVEFIRMVISAIKENEGGYNVEIGDVTVDNSEKNISFDGVTIYDAINIIADEYGTEWNLRYYNNKYYLDFGEQYITSETLVLDYGERKGLRSGVSITPESQPQIKRLWVQGTERNIDFQTYLPSSLSQYYGLTKSNRLILPYKTSSYTSNTIKYDSVKKLFGEFRYERFSYFGKNDSGGEIAYTESFVFPADYGFNENSESVREYEIDSRGRYIERKRENDYNVYQSSYTNDKVYPSKVCDVHTCVVNNDETDEKYGTFNVVYKLKNYYKRSTNVYLEDIYSKDAPHNYIGLAKLNEAVQIDTSDYYTVLNNGRNTIYCRVYFSGIIDCQIGTSVGTNHTYTDTGYVKYGEIRVNFNPFWVLDHVENFPNYNLNNKPVMVFQSGMLIGKEFEIINIIKDESKVTFKCNRQDIDNIVMPETVAGYNAKSGDKFAVFNVDLPVEYLARAEYELLKESVRYMSENEEQRYSFTGELDPLWVQNNQSDKSRLLRLGQSVVNNDFKQYGMKITKIETSICDEYKKTIEFSNGRKNESMSSKLRRKL